MTYKNLVIIFLLSVIIYGCSEKGTESTPVEEKPEKKTPPIEYYFPVPTMAQYEWQKSDLVMFFHFGINTFTDKEWGDGTENPAIFNPAKLNTDQWIKTAKAAGFKYVILTAKHHDGFCLWPSKYTEHSIKNSPYKNGQGDIVREFAEACKNNGLKFGVYLSPWDRHEKTYGSDTYNTFFQNQLTELLTSYGDVAEVWFDGANGEGPNGKVQEYDWRLYISTVKHYQPKALIAIMGPDIRWVGNEDGFATETEWCIQDPNYTLHGLNSGKIWWPSECDVSIRPGWFYHNDQDNLVKGLNHLVDIYFNSVGRNSNLLLNIPPNRDGLISDVDVNRLVEWRSKLDNIFKNDLFLNANIVSSSTRNQAQDYTPENCVDNNQNTFWASEKSKLNAELTINLATAKKINIIKLEEPIEYGQRIRSFTIYADIAGQLTQVTGGTTVGKTRLLRFNEIETSKIKIVINESLAPPALSTISAYYSD